MGSPSSSGYQGVGVDVGDTIKVSFEGLRTGAQDIDSSRLKIQAELDDLEKQVKALCEQWEGDAKEAYHHHQTQWDQAAAGLQSTLASIATAVRTASDDYEDGERNNANRFK